MTPADAVLLDVFETVLTVDFGAALTGLAEASGLPVSAWVAAGSDHGPALMTGAISPRDAFAEVLTRGGVSPDGAEGLVLRDRELLQEHVTVFPDVVPFVEECHRRGLRVGLVSNCAPNAGPLLAHVGLADLVDGVVLSCDVGSAKPDAGIYRHALAMLAADAGRTVLVDDQAAYCAGAEAVGIRAVRIDRSTGASDAGHEGAVTTLTEVLGML
ncbi:HAD-IA family hydrolase [Nocardioides sp. KIGAM211]|uniref:HAD-IA family hydrolase n=1 Tax=Nocardioides luti TaxID=2761101 RepID=A0A7X0RGI4_9ACTN|nr:HAD-IA family hydrolase [Nocardioides luti]MBB6627847.1 HAD-IA family hydrolase [Nocardioides luti]